MLPPPSNNHKYIIVVVDYFTEWDEAMPTFNNIAKTTAWFFFNHVITHSSVPKKLVWDHGTHFQNDLFANLSCLLDFIHEFSTPYYLQYNGQVEAINHVLKTMLQRMLDHHKTNWHHMLFSTLWAYRIATKTATSFTPFHLVHGIESVIPIECEIPTLHSTLNLLLDTPPLEQCLLHLENLNEDR